MCSSNASGVPTGASGTFCFGDLRLRLRARLDAPLDLANVVEIAIHAGAVGRREAVLKRQRLLDDRIENAAVLALAGETLLGRAAVAEQFFEHHLGAVFHRQRNGGRAPGNRIEVGATVTGAAAQADIFDGKLDRRQRRVLADLRGGQLIHRRADANGILLRAAAAEEYRGRARVLGAGVGARVRLVCERLLTTASWSRYFSSGVRVSENSKSLPSVAGVHLYIVAPCGT